MQTALEESATNYRANLNTLINENFNAFHQQIEEIKTAFHENNVILTNTNQQIIASITNLPQQTEELLTDRLQVITDELIVTKQEIIKQADELVITKQEVIKQANELVITKQEVIDQKVIIAQANKLPRQFFTIIIAQSACLVVAIILTSLWITNSLSERLPKPKISLNAPALDKP